VSQSLLRWMNLIVGDALSDDEENANGCNDDQC
jgi:hypothetical protein